MSSSQTPLKELITPPSSLIDAPLTPPPTNEKAFTQVPRVIALFKDIQAGRHTKQHPWIEFQLARGEYDEIERQLRRDEPLFGYVKDKIRYDYYGGSHRLVVRMPTGVHELFIDGVEDAIRSQLKAIRSGSDRAALFAQKVRPARSTEISFPHDDAQYPGVIIEVAYSQKKRLSRLVEDYLLDSDASVQVVVGLDIEYGKEGSRKATLLVWRAQIAHTTNGDELRVVREIADEAFRDDQGHPTNHPGLRLQLSDFACEELTQDAIRGEDREITVSSLELCQYIAVAEDKIRRQRALARHSILPGVKKRKRSETPPERMASDDEAKFAKQEERAAKRMADYDPDYEA
ncbi:uncharacterized protein BDZ99DRAFT_492279 [Mytilinidion resinicola]|uniref:Uncharacterized protein n=1 Tax=Mytilinidion resinicola TaxID=574789 RepID=A0A6A6Y1K3_9PEZI|nr:uncharacterized protein BDZ99DRAFT_492279 [Mytilinidion resinicola]KAF2802115.1 hypothetical protein BDZ99DRAFT_492279 [Mytilinidion resinicola]